MKTILVIDDDGLFREILAEWLETEGFQPIMAGDGFEGIRLAQAHCPDLIFCDINMPVMNGMEVLQQLRDDLSTSNIPFFFLTSESSLAIHMMQNLGANGVISKSGRISEIRHVLTMFNTP